MLVFLPLMFIIKISYSLGEARLIPLMTRLILVIYTICLNIFSCLILLSGCSSIMTHVGPHQDYYSGTKADSRILKDSDTGWVIKPLAMIDLPFSALLDTVLLPYDYFQIEKVVSLPSPKERVQNWENDQVANATQQISAKN
jgi:uncharacterized protein YceK